MRSSRRTWDAGTWPERTDRPRVLIEDPDWAVLDTSQRFLEREGYDVQVCTGPRGMGRRACPVTRGEGCRLAAGADVVFTTLAGCGPDGRAVVTGLRSRYPGTPVVAEITQPRSAELAATVDGCLVTYTPSGRDAMRAAISAALPVTGDDSF